MQTTELTDGQLLERFLKEQHEPAFEELVRRHASLVMGACRRILGNHPEVNEAFQNTFLLLLKKASSLTKRNSIQGWLYQSAIRITMNIRRSKSYTQRLQSEEVKDIPVEKESNEMWREIRPMLDEEIGGLKEKYRQPLILHYLEGLTPAEAAERLKLQGSAFRMRLMRGQDLLKDRLVRRRVVTTSVALGTLLTENVARASDGALENSIQSTVQAATTTVSLGTVSAGVGSGLLKGSLITMLTSKKILLPTVALILLVFVTPITFNSVKKIYQSKKVTAAERLPPKELVEKSNGNTSPIAKVTLNKGRDFRSEAEQILLAMEKTQEWEGANMQAFEGVIREWLQNDSSSVVQWAQARMQNSNGSFVLQAVARLWAEQDPKLAIRWADRLSIAEGRDQVLYGIAKGWAGVDPISASKWTQQLSQESVEEEEDRVQAMAAVAQVWAKKDYTAALAWIKQLPEGKARDFASKTFAAEWAEQDPSSAAQWGLQLAKGDLRRDVLAHIAGVWAKTDPVAAARWAEQLSEDPAQSRVLTSISIFREDYSAAVEWAKNLPEGKTRNEVMAHIATSWSYRDHSAGVQLALTIPAGEERNEALSDITKDWVKENLPEAIAWAEKAPTEIRAIVDQVIVQAQIKPIIENETNFSSVLSAVQELPPHFREKATLEAISNWAQDKGDQASQKALFEWIKAQPNGELKDQFIEKAHTGFIVNRNKENYPLIMDIQNQTTNGYKSLPTAFEDWVKDDPQAARQWLEKAKLREEEANQLKRILNGKKIGTKLGEE